MQPQVQMQAVATTGQVVTKGQPVPDGSPAALLEAELAKLSKRQLRQRATEAGVSSSALKDAQAGPTPKASTIELILTASQAVPMEQPMANAP